MITFLGAPILREPGPLARAEEARLGAALSTRQRRMLVGEVNAGLLAHGGRSVEVVLEVGGIVGQRTPILFAGDAAGDPVSLVVRLHTDDDLGVPPSARQRLERRFPVAYDRLRALALAGRARARIAPDGDASRSGVQTVEEPSGDAPRAVLIGMHWLDVGGAEAWAVRTVSLAVAAGLVPIVVTDRASRHPRLGDELFADVLFVPVDHLASDAADEVLRGIVARFDLRGVLIHHSRWAYDRAALLKAWRPGVRIIDSLHIVEDGWGGFPAFAVRADPWLDTHHVISPALVTWLVDRHGIAEEKVVMAPLALLTAGEARTPSVRSAAEPFVLAFVGRMTRQKRPYLFVQLVRRLRRAGVPVRAIMHGDGELDATVRRSIRRSHVVDAIELRGHDQPVTRTLGESQVLVVTSQNEGLTLTTFEAIGAGVPVLSTDVGSQRSIVAPPGLLSASPRAFLREATRAVVALAASEEVRHRLWEDERRRVEALAEHEDATSWMRGVVAGWAA